MSRNPNKWGLYDGKLAFNRAVSTNDTIRVSGTFVPASRLMPEIAQEVIVADDDGFNALREMLIRYRVAAAVAPLIGQAGIMYYNMYTGEAERRERDMATYACNLNTNERPAAGRGIKVEDNV